MASVDEVIYRSENQMRRIKVREITTQEYEAKYRGNLFCTTEGCNAKMSYVYDAKSDRGYFRNWRLEQHEEKCMYFTDEISRKTGMYREGEIFVLLTNKQKSSSLDRAFELLSMTEAEKERIRQERRSKQKKEKVINTTPKPDVNIIRDASDKAKMAQVDESVKARLGSSKSADRLSSTDLSKTKTIYGYLQSIDYDEKQATITIQNKGIFVDFKFEEVFSANSPAGLGYFYYIEKYFKEYKDIPFAALGQIRKSKTKDRYEVLVFDSDSMKINRMTLLSLAAFYKRREL